MWKLDFLFNLQQGNVPTGRRPDAREYECIVDWVLGNVLFIIPNYSRVSGLRYNLNPNIDSAIEGVLEQTRFLKLKLPHPFSENIY